MFFMLN